MDQQQPSKEQIPPRAVILRLNPNELVPDDAEVALWHNHLAEQRHGEVYYCLGVLRAAVDGAAQAIDRGDQQSLTQHVRLGLAATAAYEQTKVEQQAISPE